MACPVPARAGLVLLALGVVAGCRFLPRPSDTVPVEYYQPSAEWVEPDNPPSNYAPLAQANVEGLHLAFTQGPPAPPATPPRPLNVLALSAGGKYGAYTAGVLNGWTATGTRPQFDVVTGVSAGTILALYAYLGPEYDGTLTRFFTQTNDDDLYRYKYVRNILKYGSIATPDGLEKIIEREISGENVDKLRAAHAAGRRLFISTLNQRSKRLCVWDIGAILCSGRPDAVPTVRKVFLAACSVPGLVPPVEFEVTINGVTYTEVHADAGAPTQTFVHLPGEPPTVPGTKWLTGSNLYVIAAGKMYADPSDSRMTLLTRVGSNLSAALYALFRAELYKLWGLCLHSGMEFHLLLLDPDHQGEVSSFKIDPAEMSRLYAVGYNQARCGVPWRKLPPGAVPGEDERPRAAGPFVVTVPGPGAATGR